MIVFYCLSSRFSEGAVQLLRDFLHYEVLQTVPIRTKVAGCDVTDFIKGFGIRNLFYPPKKYLLYNNQ